MADRRWHGLSNVLVKPRALTRTQSIQARHPNTLHNQNKRMWTNNGSCSNSMMVNETAAAHPSSTPDVTTAKKVRLCRYVWVRENCHVPYSSTGQARPGNIPTTHLAEPSEASSGTDKHKHRHTRRTTVNKHVRADSQTKSTRATSGRIDETTAYTYVCRCLRSQCADSHQATGPQDILVPYGGTQRTDHLPKRNGSGACAVRQIRTNSEKWSTPRAPAYTPATTQSQPRSPPFDRTNHQPELVVPTPLARPCYRTMQETLKRQNTAVHPNGWQHQPRRPLPMPET